jgi:hypothetical protein
VKAVSVSCPSGYFAVSAGASRTGEGIDQRAAWPRGRRTFSFRLANSGVVGQRVTVAAACRRIRTGGSKSPYLKLAVRRRVKLTVPATGLKQTRFTCPSGTVPAAAGFDLGRGLSVRKATQDLHVFTFGVFNSGSAPRTASFYASCLTVVTPAGARPRQLQVSLATDTVPVHNGTQVVTRLCPRGWLSLAAGYEVPVALQLNGAAAVARTGRWTLTNPAQKPVLADLQLACARVS